MHPLNLLQQYHSKMLPQIRKNQRGQTDFVVDIWLHQILNIQVYLCAVSFCFVKELNYQFSSINILVQNILKYYFLSIAYATPFVLGVNFDNNEICASGSKYPGGNALECEGIGGAEEEANENGGAGQLGFSLCYVQHTPPI